MLKPKFFTSFLLTALLVVAMVTSCEENIEVPKISNEVSGDWARAADDMISETRDWYNDQFSFAKREKKYNVLWNLSEVIKKEDGNTVVAIPVARRGKGQSKGHLDIMYLFKGEERTSGFIVEQKPDNPDEEHGVLMHENFSGELSVYDIFGEKRNSSVVKNGKQKEVRYSSISRSGMSNARTMTETDAIILDEVVIVGERIESSGPSWHLFTFDYYFDVPRVFPGTQYTGTSNSPYGHNYSTPQSSFSSNVGAVEVPSAGPVVDIDDIIDCFSGGGTNYSISVYVEQPVPQQSFPFDIGSDDKVDTGHTFIGLTMKTASGEWISKVVGFYPERMGDVRIYGPNKETDGVFRDDYNRSYTVSATYSNVSPSGFSNVLQYLRSSQHSTFNIEDHNCADVAVDVASEAGVNLPDTFYSWPAGGGTTPGQLGEDIRTLSGTNIQTDLNGGRATPIGASPGGC